MSNYLAVAQVTATLRYLVANSLPPDLSGAAVSTQRPDGQLGDNNAAGVNIFLYRVAPNISYRNADLPSRDGNGILLKRPTVALDLDYLFTFYGNDNELEPQRLMGATTTTLYSMPVLSPEEIAKALITMPPFLNAPFTGPPFQAPPLRPDLELAFERVRISMIPLTLDELSKLWSVFYQIPYALTVAYQASVVLMQREDDVPQIAPPVQRRAVSAVPWNPPVIAAIVSKNGALAPVTVGGTILVQGSALAFSGQVITIDGYATPLTPIQVTGSQLTLMLPGDLPSGPRVLRLQHVYPLGIPALPHQANVSAAGTFTLQPTITGMPVLAGGVVTCTLAPPALKGQTVALLLNESTDPAPTHAAAYTFTLPVLTVDSATLSFSTPNVLSSRKYFVRVQVDGAPSGLNMDRTSATFGPTVTAA